MTIREETEQNTKVEISLNVPVSQEELDKFIEFFKSTEIKEPLVYQWDIDKKYLSKSKEELKEHIHFFDFLYVHSELAIQQVYKTSINSIIYFELQYNKHLIYNEGYIGALEKELQPFKEQYPNSCFSYIGTLLKYWVEEEKRLDYLLNLELYYNYDDSEDSDNVLTLFTKTYRILSIRDTSQLN